MASPRGSSSVKELLGVGLLARLSGRLIAIPLDRAGQVAELSVQPLPLMRNAIRGLAFHAGHGAVVFRLGPAARAPAAVVVAVSIELPGLPVRCALEVDGLAGMARVRRAAPRSGMPSWWIDGVADDGRAVGWVDVASLLHGAFATGEPRLAEVAG